MKKLITKSIFTFALLGTFLLGGVFAIDVINTGYSNSCNSNQSITRNYYLTDNNYTTNPSDGFTAVGTDALLFSNGTTVGIWRNGIIAQNSCNTWLRSSNAAKQGINNTLAIFNDDGCHFNIPNYTKTNSASIDAQIQYTIAYRNTPGSPSVGQTTNKFYYRTGGSSYWTCYPGGEHKNNRQDCPDATLNVGDLRTHIGECINYRIFRCGDGLVNGYNGSTSYNNGTHTEECDPNLPSSIPNGYTCNSSCQLIQNTPNPQCNSQYNGQTQYTTTTGFPWLNPGTPGLCSGGTVTNFTGRWHGFGHTAHYTWNCSNSAGSTGCSVNQNWCGDGKITNNEECDPNDQNHEGWNNNGLICNSSCQLVPDPNQQPQCNSQYNGQTQYTNNSNPWLNQNMNLCTIGSITNFTYSGTPRHFTWNCSAGGNTVSCSANQQRCGDGQLNGSEQCDYNDPTQAGWNGMQCNNSCQLYNPGYPNLTIEKEQTSTGSLTPGSLVAYKITVRNIGSGVATGVSIYDVLPRELQYMTSSISIIPNSTYQFTTGTVQIGGYPRTYLRYFNITLNANGTATVYLTGKVKNGFTFDTLTNCATVSGSNIAPHEDCVTTTPPTAPHLIINKELITAGDMTAGSTVAYKITLTNNGNATYYNAYILDILPNAIQYQTSSIQNITNYLFEEGTTGNNDYFIRYYNFDLTAGHSAIVYLTGVLKQGFNFNQTVNCAFTSGAYDCEEFPLTPVPFVQKYQKIGNDNNPNSNGWTTHTLNVELLQYISYRIDFGNSGNKAATGEVRDILPQCVQYINAYLVGANGNGPTYYPNVHTVRFKNIPLAAGQRAHMMVIGKIKQEDGCQNIYSYLNTGEFHFINKPWQNSTVLAERPNTTDVEITKTVDKNKVKSGDIVTYTITYKNMGPEILQSYTIVDYWPSEQLDFAGVIEPTTPTPIWEGNNIIKWHFNTPLGVGEQRQIIIRGIVR